MCINNAISHIRDNKPMKKFNISPKGTPTHEKDVKDAIGAQYCLLQNYSKKLIRQFISDKFYKSSYSDERIDDLAEQSIEKMLVNAGKFDENVGTLYSWCYTITINGLKSDVNTMVSRGFSYSLDSWSLGSDGEVVYSYDVASGDDIEEEVELEVRRGIVDSLLEQRSETDRIIYYATIEGDDDDELAKRLGITRCNLYVKRNRLLNYLKSHVADMAA